MQRFFSAVKTASELCQALGLPIPVGKDSLSMKSVWQPRAGQMQSVSSPVSLVVTAWASVKDIRRTWTPMLKPIFSIDIIIY